MHAVDHEVLSRCLFNESNDAFIIFDPESGSVLDVNPTTIRLTGFRKKELLSLPVAKLLEGTHPTATMELRNACNTTCFYHSREGFYLRQASERRLDVNVSISRIHTGLKTLGLIVLRDITERRRAESLREGNRRVLEQLATGHQLPKVLTTLTQVVEEQTDGMFCSVLLLDEDGIHLRHGAAPSLPDEYNRAVDGIRIGPSVGSCGTASYLNRRVVVEDIQTDERWEGYRELAAPFDLRACWSEPIVSSEGSVLGTFAMYYQQPRSPNEGELKLIAAAAHLAGIAIVRWRSEDALKNSESRFRSIFESLPDAILVQTEEGRVLDANPAACQLHGVSREALIGMNVVDLVPEDLRREMVQESTDLVRQSEGIGRRADGTDVPISIRASRIVFDGEPRWLLHMRDISERIRVEDEFRRQQAELVHVSRLTTIGELVAGMTHELTQPITAIATFADACGVLLEGGDPSSRQQVPQHIGEIQNAAERVGDIIQRLREFMSKSAPRRASCDINQIIQEAIALIAAEFRLRQVTVTLELVEPSPLVYADRVQVQQVLLNLLKNASDAMQSAGSEIRQVNLRTMVSGQEVQIEVEDTGGGVPAEIAPQIFDAFFTTKQEGLGMGLAICRTIVLAHGGRAWHDADHGSGARFFFTLPRMQESHDSS